MSSGSEALLEVGQVVGTHGLRGDIKVRVVSLDPEDLLTAEKLYLRRKSGGTELLRPLRQSLHKGNILLRLEGYDSLTAVEPLIGSFILLDEAELPELEDGHYRFHKLVGLQVVDVQHGLLGSLVNRMSTAAHDTYVVEGEAGEILIPAVPEFIIDIDLEGQIMKVDLPEDLVLLNR